MIIKLNLYFKKLIYASSKLKFSGILSLNFPTSTIWDDSKNRLEKLVQHKDKLDRDINNLEISDNTSAETRIWQEELRGLEELNSINQDIQEASELIKEIDEIGGAIPAIENHFQDNKISNSAFDESPHSL